MKMMASLTQHQLKTLIVNFFCLSITKYEATASSLRRQFGLARRYFQNMQILIAFIFP